MVMTCCASDLGFRLDLTCLLPCVLCVLHTAAYYFRLAYMLVTSLLATSLLSCITITIAIAIHPRILPLMDSIIIMLVAYSSLYRA
ncbi:hypothetical protein K438DRAFT_1835787 [Mycena galopus ATCC 62051]|nr:hypothetical protein K438DRAFT_1835787 [Mycena galopus ATCC 62051]